MQIFKDIVGFLVVLVGAALGLPMLIRGAIWLIDTLGWWWALWLR